jgi:hypothetical protein
MGAHESTEIQVNFNHPNLSYFAGEQIKGNIAFQNTHDRLIFDEIFIEFIGELGCTAQEPNDYRNSLDNKHQEHYKKYRRIPFMNVRYAVVQSEIGQVKI